MYLTSVIRIFVVAIVCVLVTSENELNLVNFANSINHFSCDLLKQLKYEDENVIFSPLSVSMALGMVLKGAKGLTEQEIYKLLRLNDYTNKQNVHTYFTDLMKDQKLNQDVNSPDFRNITIEFANLVLMAKNFTVEETFTEGIRDEYFADVGSEDFAGNGLKVMNKVNKFVKERTHDLITKVLDNPLDSDTRLFLLNSIYFKGFWETMFHRDSTRKFLFHNSDATESMVDFMSEQFSSYRGHVDKYLNITVLEMDYLGNASMIFVLPHERNGLRRVVTSVSCKDIEEIYRNSKLRKFPVFLPKFKFEYKADLKQVLSKMGLNSIFENPDLSGIAANIKVSDALHKAVISVDEGGTEAAAITSIRIIPLSAYHGPRFVADHPFLFFIRDKKSGLNLFAGVVNKL